MKNVLNASSKIREIKKSNYHWKLSNEYSLEYYHNVIYKTRLDSLFTDTKSQLSLDLHSNNTITDCSTFSNLDELNISNCQGVSCFIVLSSLHSLSIRNCKNVKNVSSLGNLRCLDISSCEEITDINALGNVYDSDISSLYRIADVSSLGNVYILNMSYCDGIYDCSALGRIHDLNMTEYANIDDVSASGNVHALTVNRNKQHLHFKSLSFLVYSLILESEHG
jgi:hypothetical protein